MSSIQARLRISIWSSIIATIFTGLLTIVLGQGQSQFLLFDSTGESGVSIAGISIVASFAIVLSVMVVNYRRLLPHTDRASWIYQVLGRILTSVLAALFTMFVSALMLRILQNAFPGAALPFFAALIVLMVAGALLGFVTAYIATHISTTQILLLAGVNLLTGLTIAALMARDRDWWTNSLSFLGWNDGSNLFFDGALILGGLLVLAAIGDVIRDLRELKDTGRITQRSFRVVQVLVIAIAVSFILIGLFPTRLSTLSFIIHQGSAYVGFGAFFALLVLLNRLLPVYPAWFIRLSYIMLGVSAAAVIAYFALRLINFVVLEIILIALLAAWYFIFAHQTDNVVKGRAGELVLTLEDIQRLRFASIMAVIAGLCALTVTLLTFNQLEQVRIFSGDGFSVAAVGLFLSFPLALITTAISYRRYSDQPRRLISRVIVSITLALVVALVVVALSYILNATFTNITMSPIGAALFIALLALATCFVIANVAPTFDGRQELTLTGVVFGLGILLTTTHVADPQWWTYSISFLGHDRGAFLLFAITMTLCGLLLIAVGLDIISMLQAWIANQADGAERAARLGILRVLLLLLGISTIGVGIFPTTVTRITNDLHNISSHGALVILLLLMFGLNRLVTAFPKQFIRIGYGLGAASILNIVLYFAGFYNYVIMEFILLIILGLWLYLFMRYTRSLTGYRLSDDLSTAKPAAG